MNKLFRTLITIFAIFLALPGTIYAQTSTTPAVEILTPKNNQDIYTQNIPVLLTVENFELVNPANNKTNKKGQGHVLLWLDDETLDPENASQTTSDEYLFENIAYGQHTLTAELVNNTGTSLVPPVTTTVTFSNLAVPSSLEEESGFDKQTAFVILIVVALVIVAAWWYTKEEDEEWDEEDKPKPKKSTKKKSTKAKKK